MCSPAGCCDTTMRARVTSTQGGGSDACCQVTQICFRLPHFGARTSLVRRMIIYTCILHYFFLIYLLKPNQAILVVSPCTDLSPAVGRGARTSSTRTLLLRNHHSKSSHGCKVPFSPYDIAKRHFTRRRRQQMQTKKEESFKTLYRVAFSSRAAVL